MPFKKGQSGNPAGRRRGSQNKVTKNLREAILQAFDEVGGVQWLTGLAESDPKAFASLLGRVLPTEVKADLAMAEPVQIRVVSGFEELDPAVRNDDDPDTHEDIVGTFPAARTGNGEARTPTTRIL